MCAVELLSSALATPYSPSQFWRCAPSSHPLPHTVPSLPCPAPPRPPLSTVVVSPPCPCSLSVPPFAICSGGAGVHGRCPGVLCHLVYIAHMSLGVFQRPSLAVTIGKVT